MERRLSYAELSSHFFHLYLALARKGETRLPVYSGDLSVALRLRHRVVKDAIEQHYLELQQAWGTSIHVVRQKRRGGCRAMKGYRLPFQAALQLLPSLQSDSELLRVPEVLFVLFVGECGSLLSH